MFGYMMPMLFSPLHLVFALLFRDDRAALVLALHQQVLILQQQLGERPSLAKGERLALVLSSLLVTKQRFTEALMIVKLETLVGWHRAIMRRRWTFRTARRPGRPPEITPEMERWVLQIARENRWMGYGKIAGEMRELGSVGFSAAPAWRAS
jgi:hypothetical protein